MRFWETIENTMWACPVTKSAYQNDFWRIMWHWRPEKWC